MFQHGIKKCRKTISNSVGPRYKSGLLDDCYRIIFFITNMLLNTHHSIRDLFMFKRSTVFLNSLRKSLERNPNFLDLFIDPEVILSMNIIGCRLAVIIMILDFTHILGWKRC